MIPLLTAAAMIAAFVVLRQPRERRLQAVPIPVRERRTGRRR